MIPHELGDPAYILYDTNAVDLNIYLKVDVCPKDRTYGERVPLALNRLCLAALDTDVPRSMWLLFTHYNSRGLTVLGWLHKCHRTNIFLNFFSESFNLSSAIADVLYWAMKCQQITDVHRELKGLWMDNVIECLNIKRLSTVFVWTTREAITAKSDYPEG